LEATFVFERLANYSVQRFNHVGNVDGLANIFRVIKQGVEIVPMAVP
jgi:hypothetical protein